MWILTILQLKKANKKWGQLAPMQIVLSGIKKLCYDNLV